MTEVRPYSPDLVLELASHRGGEPTAPLAIEAGWIPPDRLSREQLCLLTSCQAVLAQAEPLPMPDLPPMKPGERAGVADASNRMVREMLRSRAVSDLDRKLFELAAHPDQFPTLFQQSGSCVGNGLFGTCNELAGIEVAVLGQSERFTTLSLPYGYGRARTHSGLGGRVGEGAFGSGGFEAAAADGWPTTWMDGMPRPSYDRGLTWGYNAEMAWSQGDRIASVYLEAGRSHLILRGMLATDLATLEWGLRSGYLATVASDWGGMNQPPAKGESGRRVLLNRRATTWNHQMRINDVWLHPDLGRIWRMPNSWSESFYGSQPNEIDPPGCCWIGDDDMAYILRQRDSYLFGVFQGYANEPERVAGRSAFRLMGEAINLPALAKVA